MVLGPLFEQSLRQSLIMSLNGPAIFVTRPISLGLLAVAAALLVLILRRRGRPEIPTEGAMS
jgi:TctA family transporter